ncbi:MAG TPA: hypothetical protein VG389_08255 [Myxococcota bacterium]|nr:hypothetical protein [Myxococcota bacterium]
MAAALGALAALAGPGAFGVLAGATAAGCGSCFRAESPLDAGPPPDAAVPCTLGVDCWTACGPVGCAPCAADAPCGDFRGCVDGACAACTADAQCPAGTTCRFGFCGAACADDAWCRALYTAAGYNFFDVLFGTTAYPPAMFGCRLYGDYFPLCDGSPYWVPDGIRCEACSGDADCAPGQACVAGDCGCGVPEECAAGESCALGACGPCWTDDGCRCGEYCGGGVCHAACATDADCPGGRCDPASARCAWCLTDADCPSPQRCWEDGCETPCPLKNDCYDECDVTAGRCTGCEDLYPGPPPLPPPPACP